MEYALPRFAQPAGVDVEGRVYVPALTTRFVYEHNWAKFMLAGLVRPSRFQFTGGTNSSQTLTAYGGNFSALFSLNSQNRIKFAAVGGTGMSSFLADYNWSELDAVYNSATGEFENLPVYGFFLAYERDWNKVLSSTFTYSITGIDNKDFQDPLAFKDGNKSLISLFYTPATRVFDGLTFGAEVEYGQRTNRDNSTNDATRVSFLFFYDF